MSLALLLLHATAPLYRGSLIWLVQPVHDPLAARVGAEAFAAHPQAHMEGSSWTLGLAMRVERVTTALLRGSVANGLRRRVSSTGPHTHGWTAYGGPAVARFASARTAR